MPDTTVLVAEDDGDIRDAIAEILTSDGYDVVSAANGREAMDYLQGTSRIPAVILLDLMMPVVDGWECLHMIRSSARCSTVAVVVTTAIGRERRPAGVEAFLRKPFVTDELRVVVRRLSERAAV